MWFFKKKPAPPAPKCILEDEGPILPPTVTSLLTDLENWTVSKDEANHTHLIMTHKTGIMIATAGFVALEGKLWRKKPGLAEIAEQLYMDLLGYKAGKYVEENMAGGGPCPRR